MSEEERLLQLKNAINTLAELAAKHDIRPTSLEQSFKTLAELTRKYGRAHGSAPDMDPSTE
jgi:hypothetical protein